MGNKKTTKHALLVSAISLILCLTMLLGTTFAWFTDEVTSANNIIKSGTLDVTMVYSDTYTTDESAWKDASKGAIFNYDLWEPGYSALKYVKIANAGDLALKYQLNVAATLVSNGVNLSDAIDVYFGIIPDGAQAADLPSVDNKFNGLEKLDGTLTDILKKTQGIANGKLLAGEDLTVCIVLHMQEAAGNEYQGIQVGNEDAGVTVQLLATQLNSEVDSFDENYDKPAPTPSMGTGYTAVDGRTEPYYVVAMNTDGVSTKLGYAYIPANAVESAATEVGYSVEKVALNGNITLTSDQSAQTFDVNVYGVKEGNTEEIKASIYVGEDLTGVKLYHYDEEFTGTCTYNELSGYITFETADFSPFTVVYDTVSNPEPVAPLIPENMPVAIVTDADDCENIALDWGDAPGFPSAPEGQVLEAAYTFKAPHDADTIDDCEYKNWICDYVVSLDRELTPDSIFLGGNYGSFGWIGFTNGDLTLAANEEVPLLGSVTQNPWTYEDIASFVGEFICGVADIDGKLEGATFTVHLRLTNPEDESIFYNVNTKTYTF